MKKTLFIKIDNTPVPVEAENEVESLDCKQINDFCSFAGDALVGDLKDKNGMPFYRRINPVGRLLSDFEKVDKASYDKIIAQWLDILGEILHKGVAQCDEQFTIHFSQQYIDWLLCNENDYYPEIGKCLQSNEGKVFLDADGISEDIISALHKKIRRFLNDNKDDIEYIVFSNNIIKPFSDIVKEVNRYNKIIMFISYCQWQKETESRRLRRQYLIQGLPKAFSVDSFILGETSLDDLKGKYKIINNTLEYKGGTLEFRNGILGRLYFEFKNDESINVINELISFIIGKDINCREISYNEMFPLLEKKGFVLTDCNWELNNRYTSFWRIVRKEIPHQYSYRIVFHANLDEVINMEHDEILLQTHLNSKGTLRRVTLEDWSL